MSDSWTAAERDAFYQQQDAARAAFDAMRCARLQGNDALAVAVRANWEPVIRFEREFGHARSEERIIESPCPELVN